MDDTLVTRIMSTELVTVDEDAAVSTAAARMLEAGVGSVLVVDDANRLRGLLTATDFVRLVYENDPADVTPVDACMTTEVVTASAEDTVGDLETLVDSGYTHVPVVDEAGTVVGVVSTTDITERLAGR